MLWHRMIFFLRMRTDFSMNSSATEAYLLLSSTIILLANVAELQSFFAESEEERGALENSSHLKDWNIEIQPLIFSYSPAAFDEQIAYTLSAYRDTEWEALKKIERPSYGNPREEAETAEEV